MGHDIYGFNEEPTDDKDLTEVAYLRRGGFKSAAREIYKALDATQFDCGCSGCGGYKFFTNTELKSALERLQAGDEYELERLFLQRCINDNEHGVWVAFR